MKRAFFASVLFLSTLLDGGYTTVEDKNTLTIQTPSFAQRQTAKIMLENGLEVLVISDPNIEQSAAAMSVHVGQWHDPVAYPGTAHYTEHLLFLGTKTYPEEDGFMKFVQQNGGLVNAYTAFDRTVYMFSVNNEQFAPALDQFAHMFIDPLFCENGIARELQAVDAEHDKNVANDGRREMQVLKHIAEQSHPFSRFGSGNAKTLGTIPRDAVLAWHKKHYGARREHLVIYSNQPLEHLLALVDTSFAAVPRGEEPSYLPSSNIFPDAIKGKMVTITPIKDLKELNVYWELPIEYAKDTNFKTASLLAYALSSKSPTSLYATLRAEGLIEELSASPFSLTNDTGIFSIYFKLTDMGTKHTDAILERLYQAIASLQHTNIPPYLFNELRTMQQTNYAFQSKDNPFEYVGTAASNLIDEPLQTYPLKTQLPTVYDPKRIQCLLNHLQPQQAIYTAMLSPHVSGLTPTHKEPMYKVDYAIHSFSELQLRAWKQTKPHPKFALQKPNPYLPKNLSLVEAREELSRTPTLLKNERIGKLYFAQDTRYRTPTIAWNIGIRTPLLEQTATSDVLSDLYITSVAEKRESAESYAHTAGLYSNLSKDGFAFTISVGGYSDKSLELLRNTLQTMKHVETTERDFALYKQSLLTTYENSEKDLPISVARRNVECIVSNDTCSLAAKKAALKQISYSQYRSFEKHVLDTVYFEGMTLGNMTLESAHRVWHMLTKEIGGVPYVEEDHVKKRFLSLRGDQGPYKVVDSHDLEGNVAYLMLQAGSFTFDAWASHAVLGRIVNPNFFETLRTKQQTGYITRGMSGYVDSELVHVYFVQSASHEPEELVARFELFLETYTKNFDTMVPQEQFESARASLIASLQAPQPNLRNLCAEYVNLAFTHDGNFAFREQQITALQSLTYDQFKRAATASFTRANKRRLAYLLHGKPHGEKSFQYLLTDANELQESAAFVSWK